MVVGIHDTAWCRFNCKSHGYFPETIGRKYIFFLRFLFQTPLARIFDGWNDEAPSNSKRLGRDPGLGRVKTAFAIVTVSLFTEERVTCLLLLILIKK